MFFDSRLTQPTPESYLTVSVGSKPFSLAWVFKARTKPWCWSIVSALGVEPSELVKAG
jgi:hypothetical protein